MLGATVFDYLNVRDLELLDAEDLLGADDFKPTQAVPMEKSMQQALLARSSPVASPAPSSMVRKAGLLAGGVGLLIVGLGLTAAPIVVAVLIVRAVTK